MWGETSQAVRRCDPGQSVRLACISVSHFGNRELSPLAADAATADVRRTIPLSDDLHVMTLLQRCLLIALCLVPAQAAADFELSVYTGVQSVADSDVEGSDPFGLGDFDFSADWEGRSGETPPYYGIRGTWWREDDFGFGLEFTHNKVYASDDTLQDEGFDTLEFTDGQNLVTAHVMRRFTDPGRRWTPYVGAGLGVNIPYVEVETDGTDTFEYQYAGPAATWMA